jgi:hypothetical protein
MTIYVSVVVLSLNWTSWLTIALGIVIQTWKIKKLMSPTIGKSIQHWIEHHRHFFDDSAVLSSESCECSLILSITKFKKNVIKDFVLLTREAQELERWEWEYRSQKLSSIEGYYYCTDNLVQNRYQWSMQWKELSKKLMLY